MSELFKPYPVLLETTYGIVLKCYIKSSEDEVKLRQLKNDWSNSGAKTCAASVGAVNETAPAQSAPVALLERRDQGAVSFPAPPLGAIWRGSPNEKEKLKSQLSELREAISDMAETIEGYNRLLAPYWYAKGDIEDSVRRTHGGGGNTSIVFKPDGAVARKPKFDALMELAIEWGPTKHERAELLTRMGAFEREAKKIVTELKYLEKKKGKKNG